MEDFEPWFAMFEDRSLFRFINAAAPSREDAWNRLLRYAGHWTLLGYGLFAVFDRANGAFLGEVGLADFHRGLGPAFDGVPEAAWILTAAAQGRGLAREAVTAAHDWLDGARVPARTVCLINPENVRSVRLAERLGYSAFGTCTYKDSPCTMFERLKSGTSGC